MQSFKITREELLKFAQRLYQEACCGYLDLCETVADGMVTDFLDGREPIGPSILTNMDNVHISVGSGSFGYGGMTGGVDPAAPPPAPPGSFQTSGTVFGSNVGLHEGAQSQYVSPESTYEPRLPPHGLPGNAPPAFTAALAAQRTAPSGVPHEEILGGNVAMTAEAGVVITETQIVREEVFVRDDNYHGNQSERL